MSFAKDQVIPQLYQIAKDLPISIKFTFGLISIWCLLKIFNSFRIYYSHRLHGTSLRETDNKGRNEFQELPVVAQEPPAIPHNIPFLGHIFGLLWNRMNYHAQINQQRHLPIYTLAVPGSKIYVVNSPELITAVQKSKTLAFAPLEVQLARRLFRPSTHGGNEMTSNTNTEKGERGLYSDGIDAIHAALLPGEGLDEMNRIAIQNIAASCDKLDSRAGAPPVRIKLMQWLRHEITMATTNSVYGPMNPFKDPKIEAEFWNFEHNIGTLIINVLPSLTARKAHLGRERMAKAFTEYFARKGHESASVLVKNRFKVCADYNLSLEDTARFEIGGVIAITVSTIPAAFWMLYYVFSKPEILALLRKEVGGVLETTNFDDTLGSITRTLNITKLRTACPLLTSTFQETLRHGALGASIRLVVEDTIISGQYLLKKDCVVQIPTHVVHFDPSIWGSSVDDFDASRFVPGHTRLTDAQGKQKKKAPPGALRPFGGGKNLCPGRHFAATEILALVSMILMRYELYVVTASDEHQHRDGEWAMPKSEKSSLAAVVREPDEDTEVEIRLREGYEEGRWAFRLDDSELVFAIDDD